ncbi:1-cys peroxiredoxin A [Citrus sinensis]|nr:1-cys peroxiredoxin A [Citrus sinensis]
MPGLTIGDSVPNLQVQTNQGNFKLHDFIGDSWTIIFSHPGDFTPVCTTELGKMAAYVPEFDKREVKLLDPNREIIKQLNMVDPDEKDSSGKQLPSRALHIVGPDHQVQVKLSFLYPASTGRNMDEVVRALDSLQKAMKHKVATPANWKQGDPVVISPSVSSDQAKEMFPQGFQTVDLPSKKEYLRFTNV